MSTPRAPEIVVNNSPVPIISVADEQQQQQQQHSIFHAGDTILLENYDVKSGAWDIQINGIAHKGRIKLSTADEFDFFAFPKTAHEMYKLAISPFFLSNKNDSSPTPRSNDLSANGNITSSTGSLGVSLPAINNSTSPRMNRATSRDQIRTNFAIRNSFNLLPPISPRNSGRQTMSLNEQETLAAKKQFVNEEVNDITNLLYESKMELKLIIKAFIEDFGGDLTELEKIRFPLIKQTPKDLAFSKLLSQPYFNRTRSTLDEQTEMTLTKTTPSNSVKEKLQEEKEIYQEKELQTTEELALAPSKQVHFRFLINPVFNLNAVSSKDLDLLDTLDFDVLPYQEEENIEYPLLLLFHIFRKLGLIDAFHIPHRTLYRFLKVIGYRYRNVPFHNFYHAFNVTQTMYYFLITGVKSVLTPLEKLAMIISTLCHDCDHPGLNNSFQSKANTRVALLHRKSTLENHHLLHCLSILSQEEFDILVNLTNNEKEAVLLFIRNLILVTDMSLHGVIHRRLVDRKKAITKSIKNKEILGDEDRILVMCTLMKCSDLSNEIRPNHMAQKWAIKVLQEFFSQAQKERTLSLPVTPFMDQNKIIIAKEQINFIKGLCMPLYEHLIVFFPSLSGCVEQMQMNREAWENRLNNFFFDDPEARNKLSDVSLWAQKGEKNEKVINEKLGLKGLLSSRSTGPNK